jgi:CRISPR/Cas system type I-B associated protein Csh2 (Cas7 group RAMP superfamily)
MDYLIKRSIKERFFLDETAFGDIETFLEKVLGINNPGQEYYTVTIKKKFDTSSKGNVLDFKISYDEEPVSGPIQLALFEGTNTIGSIQNISD